MRHTATVQKLYDAFGRGDVPTIVSFCDEKIDFDNTRVASNMCPWNGNFSGTDRLPEFFATLARELDFRVFAVRDFMETGNKVAVTITVHSTLKRNGRTIENESVHVWDFNDAGKVVKYRHFNDTAAEMLAWNA